MEFYSRSWKAVKGMLLEAGREGPTLGNGQADATGMRGVENVLGDLVHLTKAKYQKCPSAFFFFFNLGREK